jgi:regulator of protease activity HflC (stomatin/prohibitin superfamily)
MEANTVLFFGVVVVLLYLWSTINILREYERGVVFRLGRLLPDAKGPGLIFILWPVYKMVRVSLRTVTLEVPPQDIITRDNVSVKVNAIVYFRVMNAPRAIVEVEVKQVDLPQEMQRAMAKQAEAEREKRAKIIHADGEAQAAAKLAEAAGVISKEPVALQLRYLQTLTEIGVEKNTTVVFPIPIDIIRAWIQGKS